MIIAVVNQKGGTGKTTTTINLGSALALNGKKVLLVDMDTQGNLSYSLGLMDLENTISDALLGLKSPEEVMVHDLEGMSLLPSNISLADAEFSIAQVEEREFILKKILEPYTEVFDYILIDCPPSLSVLTLNALCAAQRILIPMQMEVLSLQGLDLIVQTTQKINATFNEELAIMGILPVMVDSRRRLSEEVHDHIAENYDIRIFDSKIRNNVKASEAPSFGMSVVGYDITANSAKDYLAFTEEFLNLNEQ